MHIGGGFSNEVVREAEPSAGGHGVSPLIDSPVGSGGRSTGFFVVAAVVVGPVLDTVSSLPPGLTRTATPAMRTRARNAPAKARVRVCWRLRAAAIAACRACWLWRWRLRLSVGNAFSPAAEPPPRRG